MIANTPFFRVGNGWIDPRKICFAHWTDDYLLVVYLVHGRLCLDAQDSLALCQWLEDHSCEILTDSDTKNPLPTDPTESVGIATSGDN